MQSPQVSIENLQFSALERKIYDSVFVDAKNKFQQLNEQGLVSRNYTHILALLMRYVDSRADGLCHLIDLKHVSSPSLRRAVLHPSLVISSNDAAEPSSSAGSVDVDTLIQAFKEEESSGTLVKGNLFAEGVLSDLGEASVAECPICLDVSESPVMIPGCMHQWCVVRYSFTL